LTPAPPPAPVEEEVVERPAAPPRRPAREAGRSRPLPKNRTPRSRLIGLLSYDTEPDRTGTDHLRQIRYGRTTPYTQE
ncbi:MAG: hypothetical protein KC910_07245, partial [Candidatus Eremiobacteraeota bacterium]|nr:hypothetical protein [Candidatus Eremiobacteraeota bacterium]